MLCLLVFQLTHSHLSYECSTPRPVSWSVPPKATASATLCGRCTGCQSSVGFSSNFPLMRAVNNGTSTTYVVDTTTPISSLSGHRKRRSAASNQYEMPHTRSKFGDRAFSVAKSCEWNNLHSYIRTISDMFQFLMAPLKHTFIE